MMDYSSSYCVTLKILKIRKPIIKTIDSLIVNIFSELGILKLQSLIF